MRLRIGRRRKEAIPIFTKSTVFSDCLVEVWEDSRGNCSVGWYRTAGTLEFDDTPREYKIGPVI